MQIRKIFRINIAFSSFYFVIVLVTTILTRILGVTNPNNMKLRVVLCLIFAVLMMFISFENYITGKEIFDMRIESRITRTCVIFYYLFVCASVFFFVFESVTQYKANGAYIMSIATVLMLNVVNNSLKKQLDN